MVGVWLSGVFIFAGDNNDNKYEAIKSNINSRNCFFILILTAFTIETKTMQKSNNYPQPPAAIFSTTMSIDNLDCKSHF